MRRNDTPFLPIDFALADRICRWHDTDSALLFQTALATSFALQQGHSCLSLSQCLLETPYQHMSELGGIDFPEPEHWQAELMRFGLAPTDNSPLVLDNGRVYLRRYWQFEQELASNIAQKQQAVCELGKDQLKLAKAQLSELFGAPGREPNWQQVAAANALLNSFNVIIGGPGTGKTYTVTRILALLAQISSQPLTIKLAAPTGKAAQRLAESIMAAKSTLELDLMVANQIPSEAQTLHRLLGVIPNQLQFRHTAENPLEADVILIDEVSMVDLPMMTRLFRAIRPETKVILLGDADQLPSVAAGSVLADLVQKPHPGYSAVRQRQLRELGLAVSTGELPADAVTELTFSRRFSGDSGIGALANAVIAGDAPRSLEACQHYDDLNWYSEAQFEQQLNRWVTEHYKPIGTIRDKRQAFEKLAEFRILCALRDGEYGVEAINRRIGARLNVEREPFYPGQPIMISQNHYGLRLFNGDVGLVMEEDDGQLMIWFEAESGYRAVAPGRLPSHETVYAMTIHKTQGSEFGEVALVMPQHTTPLLTRELIYTGLTRAKQKVNIVGQTGIWRAAVEARVARWAGLADAINSKC